MIFVTGGGKPHCVLFNLSQYTSTNISIMAGGNESYDPKYFSQNADGTYNVLKSGTYYIRIGTRGVYNTSGSRVDGKAYFYKGNASLFDVTNTATAFVNNAQTITLNAGETISLRAQRINSTSTVSAPVYMFIETR